MEASINSKKITTLSVTVLFLHVDYKSSDFPTTVYSQNSQLFFVKSNSLLKKFRIQVVTLLTRRLQQRDRLFCIHMGLLQKAHRDGEWNNDC